MTNVKKSVIAGGEFQAAFPLALNHPRGIVNCFSANNNDIFFVEEGNHCIRKISQGTTTIISGGPDKRGFKDGDASIARFDSPFDLVIVFSTQTQQTQQQQPTLFISDANNHVIRKITFKQIQDDFIPDKISTLAGTPNMPGYTDGLVANFSFPWGLVIDSKQKFLFNCDSDNNCIRSIEISTGNVSTLCGDRNSRGFADGVGTLAKFSRPSCVVFSLVSNSLFVSDTNNHSIRKIQLTNGLLRDGVVSTLFALNSHTGSSFFKPFGKMYSPLGLAIDSNDQLYVCESLSNSIRKLSAKNGSTDPFFGFGNKHFAIESPVAISISKNGDLIVSEFSTNRIVKISDTGAIPIPLNRVLRRTFRLTRLLFSFRIFLHPLHNKNNSKSEEEETTESNNSPSTSQIIQNNKQQTTTPPLTFNSKFPFRRRVVLQTVLQTISLPFLGHNLLRKLQVLAVDRSTLGSSELRRTMCDLVLEENKNGSKKFKNSSMGDDYDL